MKRKSMQKFIALFDHLPDADNVLSGKYIRNRRERLDICAKLKTAHDQIFDLLFNSRGIFLEKVTGEINDNLYKYPLSREDYIKDLLRSFAAEIKILDKWIFRGVFEVKPGDPLYDKESKQKSYVFQSIEDGEDKDKKAAADYIMACSTALWMFSDKLDARCLHFSLDLMDIQKEVGIFIHKHRALWTLGARYKDKIKWLEEKAGIAPKAKPDSDTPAAKPVKSFPDWLKHDKRDELAVICKKIFNDNESPKEYAVMFCLLSSLRIILIARGQRKEFYKAWYAFIGKPFDPGSNYYAINKYIVEKPKDGFCFNGVEKDFSDLAIRFSEALESIY
jgi:hypothetical protein